MTAPMYKAEFRGKRRRWLPKRSTVIVLAAMLLCLLVPVGGLAFVLLTAEPAPSPVHEQALRELAAGQQRDPDAPNRHADLVAAIDRYNEQRAEFADFVIEDGRRKHPNNTARPYHINLDALINRPDYPDERHAFEVEDAKAVIADIHARNLTTPIFEILRHPNLANDYRPNRPHPTLHTPMTDREFPEWSDLRSLTSDQSVMIRLALDERDFKLACRLLLQSATIPPVLTRQAMLIEHLVGASCARHVLDDAVRIATHDDVDRPALRITAEAIRTASDLGDFTVAIRSEEHVYADLLDSMSTSDGRFIPSAHWAQPSDYMEDFSSLDNGPPWYERALEDSSSFYVPYRDERVGFLQSAIPLLIPAATSADPSVRKSAIEDCKRFIDNHRDRVPVMAASVETLIGVIDRRWQLQRDIAAAETILAMAAYRLDTGDWPDGIAPLVPDYLAEHPTDPVTGKPLEYRHEPGEAPTVESFGETR